MRKLSFPSSSDNTPQRGSLKGEETDMEPALLEKYYSLLEEIHQTLIKMDPRWLPVWMMHFANVVWMMPFVQGTMRDDAAALAALPDSSGARAVAAVRAIHRNLESVQDSDNALKFVEAYLSAVDATYRAGYGASDDGGSVRSRVQARLRDDLRHANRALEELIYKRQGTPFPTPYELT